MTLDYSIAAIPTVYRGRRYRSRLEAKWAAFFDLLGWKAEYEPEDLGKWSPDFRILTEGPHCSPVYAEVKPIDRFHQETADKMLRGVACLERSHVLLLGTAPLLAVGDTPHNAYIDWRGTESEIGWGASYWSGFTDYDDDINPFLPATLYPIEGERLDIFQSNTGGWIYGIWDYPERRKFPPFGWRAHIERIAALWSEASNTVQWHGKNA